MRNNSQTEFRISSNKNRDEGEGAEGEGEGGEPEPPFQGDGSEPEVGLPDEDEYGDVDLFASRRFVFRNLGKYEKYCAKIRGGTIFDVGPFSDELCVYTDQDGESRLSFS